MCPLNWGEDTVEMFDSATYSQSGLRPMSGMLSRLLRLINDGVPQVRFPAALWISEGGGHRVWTTNRATICVSKRAVTVECICTDSSPLEAFESLVRLYGDPGHSDSGGPALTLSLSIEVSTPPTT